MIKIFNFDDDKLIERHTDRFYAGRGGKKEPIKINGKYYILKKPNNLKYRTKRDWENIEISYNNSPLSEYIGSHIYNIIGVKAHNTILGISKNKLCVACEDFRKRNEILQEFKDIKISYNGNDELDERTNGNGAYMSSILETIRNAPVFKELNKDAEEYFWEMFIIDFLIGNIDRNNGNWGILINETTNTKCFAPVYDNGNCLNNLISDNQIKKCIENNSFDILLKDQPGFFIDNNDKPINMYEYIINSINNTKLQNSIVSLIPKINIQKINEMIDDIPLNYISTIRNEYYKKIINDRYTKCLIPIYENLTNLKININHMINTNIEENKNILKP